MKIEEISISDWNLSESVRKCKHYDDGICRSGCASAEVTSKNACKFEDEFVDCPCYK